MRYFRYRSSSDYRPSFGGFSFLPPVIRFILLANVGVFLLGLLFGQVRIGGGSVEGWIEQEFALWPIGSSLFRPWQLLSYMFLHAGFGHIFFNMFGLWMFGVELEQIWGSRRFGVYYTLCGIGGALGQLFVAPLFANPAPAIGASGAIFGVLLAFGMMFPDRMIYLYFLIPVKVKYFVVGYVLLEIFAVGGSGNVAHLAHLGGAAAGLLYLLIEDRLPIDAIFDWFTHLLHPPPVQPRPQQRQRVDATYAGTTSVEDRVTQETIDRILDKISKSGYQNLTEEEKRILFEASKKIH